MNVFKGGMKMQDKIEKIGNKSIIQHGEHNKRIYLIKLDESDADTITSYLNKLARENSYTKIFCKVPAWSAPLFYADGYILEAFIPRFYNGYTGVCFMSKFLNSDRLLGMESDNMRVFSQLLRQFHYGSITKSSPPAGLNIRKLGHQDTEAITGIYSEVFKSYPFPIHDQDYIRRTMDDNVWYFGVEDEGKLVALSSTETDMEGKNAEMTDFATLPQARGKKLSVALLDVMEDRMAGQGIVTFYTIARLNSLPMNKTFLSKGYRYAGTLINNTNIAGDIESMNVLYKHVKKGKG
ncbi:MAG: putative beta-lysine N-acetyltransferase [Bacteroidales bacterium]|nr:putative beta-lysine N-acetyltransferase [Bacteroidales bacterium]